MNQVITNLIGCLRERGGANASQSSAPSTERPAGRDEAVMLVGMVDRHGERLQDRDHESFISLDAPHPPAGPRSRARLRRYLSLSFPPLLSILPAFSRSNDRPLRVMRFLKSLKGLFWGYDFVSKLTKC